MPSLSSLFQQDRAVKMLVVGNSGAGKTGALASLAKAGYKVHIADFDMGLDSLLGVMGNDSAIENVSFEAFYDDVRKDVAVPKAVASFLEALDNKSGVGPVMEFDENHVLVLDSLSSFAVSMEQQVMRMNAQRQMRIQDWGEAVQRTEMILRRLCSPAVRCHVIVTAHLVEDKDSEGAVIKYFPKGVTKQQSRSLPRLFNTVVEVATVGAGSSLRRVIRTQPQPRLDLKCPFEVPAEIPIERGYLPIIEAKKKMAK